MAGLQHLMNKGVSEFRNSISTATSLNVVNTPLHRAAQQGHICVCWLLIVSGFSTDDIDNVGNTPLHLAAANGHFNVVSFLIDVGADPHRKNRFDLTAIDVTSSNECRTFLRKALQNPMKRSEERESNRRQQIEKYILKEKEILQQIDNINAGEQEEVIEFEKVLNLAQQFGILPEVIEQGRKAVNCFSVSCDIKKNMILVKVNRPVTTPSRYHCVNQLKKSLKSAELDLHRFGLTFVIKTLILEGNSLCGICCAEYWLHDAIRRLNRVSCASEDTKTGLERLRENIEKAEITGACDENLLKEAFSLNARLISELDLLRACNYVPDVRLPVPGMTAKEARDYWKDEDKGFIVKTEDYPFPSKDTNEYEWKPSVALSLLRTALDVTKKAAKTAVEANANAALNNRSEIIVKEMSNDVSLLEIKDAQDFQIEVAEAKKMMKKLRKSKKKK